MMTEPVIRLHIGLCELYDAFVAVRLKPPTTCTQTPCPHLRHTPLTSRPYPPLLLALPPSSPSPSLPLFRLSPPS